METEILKKIPEKKFKKKVLVIFILISIIPLITIFTANIYLIIINRQQTIVEQQQLAVDNASNKITKYFQEQSQGLSLVVSAPINSIRELSFNDINFLLKNSYESGKPISLDFIDNQGVITAKINAEGKFFYSSEYLSFIASSSPSTLSNANPMGSLEADVSNSPDYMTAISGESYYGLLEFVDNSPVMRIASQIKNQEEKIIGVVSAEINLRDIEGLIKDMQLGKEGFIYIVNKEGALIASGNQAIGKVGSLMTDNQIVKSTLQAGATESRFQTYLSPINKTVVWNSKLLQKTGWNIFCEWPITDAFSVLRNLVFWSSLISLGILFLVFISAMVFTGTITKPINQLAMGAGQIKSGNLKYKMELQTGDEFELLGDQFNEMIKVLNENQRLRDEFVFIAAHELRTPVTAIRGYMEMVLDGTFGPVSDTVSKNLKIVEKANNNLVDLVDNLLEIARSEAGKTKIEMTDIDLNDKISTVCAQLVPLANEKNIKINFESLHPQETVKADSGKLNEVLVNIIGNAIKYTLSDGAIDIWQEDQNGTIVTHIKDHGIGMAEEDLNKLFSKFYRVKTNETATIQGTGLGLFITKEIVERMEGKIWVESKKGEGSTFSFSLNKTI